MEKAYDFRKKLLQVHEPGLRRPDISPTEKQILLTDGIRIELSPSLGEVARTAAYDFADFLRVSMELSGVTLADGLSDVPGCVRLHEISEDNAALLGDANRYKGFSIRVERAVDLYAHDERGIAQALFWLEDRMSFAHAPILERGEERRWAMFSPQMVHSVYGLDDYPDEYLARIAHEGRDAILVFTKGVNQTPGGYLDFNALIRRAARWGLSVYAYSYLHSDMSPEAPEAEAYYDNTYGRLFRECPGLAGVTLVGESVEFPSRDPHVAKGRYYEINKDGIPSDKVSSGWYPCEDYPVWLNMVKRVVRKYKSDADIVFWTYNWGFQPEEARVRLIESLPTDISLQATFEMFEPHTYGETQAHCADYTLSFAGPGAYFKSEAIAAKKRGIRLYSMTNTGGRTWDFGTAPYEPMPFQWMRLYDAMRAAKDDWGLCGIMESHHYGFYPSLISKLSKWAFTEPRIPLEEVAETVIRGEFGDENYVNADKALRLWSDAIRFYTPTNSDQYGAFRVGPSYPLCLDSIIPIPSSPEAMFGNGICASAYSGNADRRDSILNVRLPEEIRSLEKMESLMREGVSLLEAAPVQNQKIKELAVLGRFLLCSVITGTNAKRWYQLKTHLHSETTKSGISAILDEMEALLRAEKENAESAIPLVEEDSSLGWEPSMLYMTDRWHIEWKIRQIDAVLSIEIPNYRKCLER